MRTINDKMNEAAKNAANISPKVVQNAYALIVQLGAACCEWRQPVGTQLDAKPVYRYSEQCVRISLQFE